MQAPGVAELEAVPLRAVRLDLADVVQQRARDRHVAVDPRKRRADRAHSLRDAETVLQQPVAIGLVVVLGRRRHSVGAPHLRALAEQALEQHPQVGLLDGRHELADLAFHLAQRSRGAVEQVGHLEASRLRRLESAQIDLRAEARMQDEAPAHPHGLARTRQLLGLGELLPHHAHDSAEQVRSLCEGCSHEQARVRTAKDA